MTRILLLAALTATSIFCAQGKAPIPPGAKIYIVPDNGFDTFLAAAIERKHVPLVIVSNKEDADFTVDSTSQTQKAGWAKTIFINPRSDEEASIRVTRNSSGEVVFAYAVNKASSVHGRQSTAEACAKHLRAAMKP
jgi:hypothetical protein